MKIVLATPLYPPDIAEPAPYVKELAGRLSATHSVVVVTYGRLPEKVAGVSIIAINKRQPLAVRLFRYTFALWQASRQADVLYAQNGPSVELPLGLVSFFTRAGVVLHIGDKAAHTYAAQHPVRRMIERFSIRRATLVVDSPDERPEVLPFEPRPETAFAAYEHSWDTHMLELQKVFDHVH